MILHFKCIFGVSLDISLADRLGQRVEVEAIEFLNGAPIEWRIKPDDWRSGLHKGRGIEGLHDLQRFVVSLRQTRGIPAAHAILETRGIGESTVLIWPRIGTYSEY